MIHRFEYQIANNGRPDFATNFFGPGPSGEGEIGGPRPSWDAALASACDLNGSKPGCTRRAINQEIVYPGRSTPYSHQASVGVQRQITSDSSIEVNYVYTHGTGEEVDINANLTYNPATGANYPFTDISHRPFPDWGIVLLEYLGGYSNYHGTDFTFTKRFSHRWQATATYTLAFFKDGLPPRQQWYLDSNGVLAHRPVGFQLAPDLGGDYDNAGSNVGGGFGQAGDQRNRAVVNGVWDLGLGVQASGIYFYGSGERFQTLTGQDRRDEGGTNASEQRLLADGTIIRRNGIVGTADPSRRYAAAKARAGRSRDARWDVRGFQSVQSQELRFLCDERQRPELRAANVQRQPGISAADDAARGQGRLLRVADLSASAKARRTAAPWRRRAGPPLRKLAVGSGQVARRTTIGGQ
jgi:hypothetical protein